MPQRRVAEITEKYFSRAVGANVTFGRGPNNDFTCDIVAPVAQGVVLKASLQRRAKPRWRSTAPPTASKSSFAATPTA